MSELLGKFYDEKTTKLFELVINKLLKKNYQWFDRIIVNKLSYSKDQNYLGVDARLFADEDWLANQWGKFYYSKPMPSGTEDDPILFQELIGGELSKKLQDYFKDVFVIVTSEKPPIVVPKENEEAPFDSSLFVTIYSNITILPSCRAAPSTPSPK